MFRKPTFRRLLAATAVAAIAFLPAAQPALADHANANEKALRKLINGYREDRGRSTLGWQEKLINKARAHSREMREEGELFHSSQAQLRNYASAGKCDTGLSPIAEIIALGPNLEIIFDNWKRSPDHNAAMLKKKWDKIGVGVAVDDQDTLWATVLFCNTK